MMEPFCVALTAAIEQAANAFGKNHVALEPESPVVAIPPQRRNPDLCAGLLGLADTFLRAEYDIGAYSFPSPIEKTMAVALAHRRGPFGLRIVPMVQLEYEMCREFARLALAGIESGAAIFPQANIGPYYLDFLLLFKNSAQTILGMAVECDGHEFHEKTKEQAARDKKRDRYIVMHSIPMLRFTGAEIHYKAADCAEEVHRAMLSIQNGPRSRAWLGYLSEAEQERRMQEEQWEAEREADHRQRLLEDERRQEMAAELAMDEGLYP